MTTTWQCLHCCNPIALIKDGRVEPTDGCRVVRVNVASRDDVYCCLNCGALQMTPQLDNETAKSPTKNGAICPCGCGMRKVSDLMAEEDREGARRYRVLKTLLSRQDLIFHQSMSGATSISGGDQSKIAVGISLDAALDRVEKGV